MPKFKLMQKLVDRLNLVAREILTGTSCYPCTFSREKYEEERFDEANKDLDEDAAVHQPRHDFYDAGDDADYELRYRLDRVGRRPGHRCSETCRLAI